MSDIGPIAENNQMDGLFFGLEGVGVVLWLIGLAVARSVPAAATRPAWGFALLLGVGLPAFWNIVLPAPEVFTALGRILFGGAISLVNALLAAIFFARLAHVRGASVRRTLGHGALLVLGCLAVWTGVMFLD